MGAGVNTGTSIGEEAGASCPLQNQRTETTLFSPFLSNRWQGRHILEPSSLPFFVPPPPPRLLLSDLSPPSWTRTLPNEARKTQAAAWEGRSAAASAHPLPTATFSLAISPLFSHLSLSFPYFPPLAQQPILSPASSQPVLCFPGWLACLLSSPSHTAGLLGQASAREGREGCLLTTTPSQPAADRFPGLHL